MKVQITRRTGAIVALCVGGTLAAAALIGLPPQSSQAASAAPTPTSVALPKAPEAANAPLALGLPQRAFGPVTVTTLSASTAPESGACTVALDARATPAALIDLSMTAPCAPHTRVEIWHEDMVITGLTDADGSLRLTLPALHTPADLSVGLPDGSGAQMTLDVPDVRAYRRIVVQTAGVMDVELHVLENGAAYETLDHVHPGNPRTIAHALSGQGGFLTVLGDPTAPEGHLIQAYTLPRTAPDPAITLEAAITLGNCGQSRSAMALQTRGGTPDPALDIVLELPACDAVGDLLLVPDPFEIAAR